MKYISTLFFVFCTLVLRAQEFQSIHQQELEFYNAQGHSTAWYEENVNTEVMDIPSNRVGCTPDKIVYGWHPYWVGSAYTNYDWSLLTHFSFFSYEVNPINGEALSTHGWSTSAAVDAALASGVKVTLCVTLFGGTELTTFLTNSTAKQTLIDNLINLVQTRGAHGVNIDFEGLPSSQTVNFANFMVDLSNQMHTAIPGSEVSTVLYAVDWNNVFDFSIMEPAVDHYIVMGYAYYYQGSSNTGPCDPLYHFGSSYNYTLSKTITDYIEDGCPRSKLVMGLPYYGYEWPTTSSAIPSATTGSGTARTYSYVKNNTSGNYSTTNHIWDQDSYTDIYSFNSSGEKQCFITLEDGFRKRLQHIRISGIAGIGIWALGYDNGYTDLWDGISDFLTECYEDSCSGIIHDFGGPYKNYYNNEDYTWTLSPPGASSLNISFTQFNLELNYDYLYIYDGPSTSSTLLGVYTGTDSPGNFSTSTGSVTFRFTSDGATVAPGFLANYTCVSDVTPPTTSISTSGIWKTTDFNVTFTDDDDVSISDRFFVVSDYNGTEWRSNADHGFFTDHFQGSALHAEWISEVGTWGVVTEALLQSDESVNNSNIHANLVQDDQHAYLYHWQGEINGAGANRRAGLHFFCSDPNLDQRGDSYMVFWRADQNKCQIYKSTGNSIVLMTDDDVIVDPGITYDFKIYFNPQSGLIQAYLDDQLVSEWVDSSPFSAGISISPRTGNAIVSYDNFIVYKSRDITELITIGSTADALRYQNMNPSSPAGKINSIILDDAQNFSLIDEELLNIDWTNPSTAASVNDGSVGDVDAFNTASEISANWSNSTDVHSEIASYWYAVGTSPGSNDILDWTDNGLSTFFQETGLSLTFGETYYTSVKSINGAGLESGIASSDGQILQTGTLPPTSNFTIPGTTIICDGELITYTNTSANASSFFWEFQSGIPATSTDVNPSVAYTVSGSFEVILHAIEGTDTSVSSQFVAVTLADSPQANFTSNSPAIWPNSEIFFTNTSTDATTFSWDFGDGNTSSDFSPWNDYSQSGDFTVSLIASNGVCPNDTVTYTVQIINTSGLHETISDLKIFPNPFNDFIILEGLTLDQNCTLIIYDGLGKRISGIYFEVTEDPFIIPNLSELSSGFYILEILNGGNSQRFSLVKK